MSDTRAPLTLNVRIDPSDPEEDSFATLHFGAGALEPGDTLVIEVGDSTIKATVTESGRHKLPTTAADAMLRLLEPDWTGTCDVCGESPIVPCTGMCGPCTFGEAETAGGNW